MKKLKHLQHILVTSMLSLSILFGSIMLFSKDLQESLNGFFIYRTGLVSDGLPQWQDTIYKHSLTPSGDIVIIKIDERTLNALQAKSNLKMLAIPKSTYANLVDTLEGVGVKGIGFDILFQNADPDEHTFADTLAKYDNIAIASQYIENLCAQSYGDIWNNLGDDQKKAFSRNARGDTCDKELYKILKAFPVNIELPSKYKIILEKKGEEPSNTEKLMAYCDSSDTDGTIDCPGLPRSIYQKTRWGIIDINSAFMRPINHDISDQPYNIWKIGTGNTINRNDLNIDTLPLALYRATHTGAISSLKSFLHLPASLYTTKSIPTALQPYFRGVADTSNTYKTISLIDVLKMSRASAFVNFSGKYVFIGVSSTAVNDSKISPVTGDNIDGVELHAHFLDGLLQNKMLSRFDYDFVVFALLTLVMSVLYFYIPSYLSPVLAGVMMVVILWISRYLYDQVRILVDIFPLFLAGGLLTFPMTFIYRFFVVDREKHFIENAFGHYIDPKMVKMIDMEEVEASLGGEQKEVTVFFSDIAGFTTISEKLGTQELFYLMSAYLSRETDILIGEGGTLDKYIGDAVMGFFGAPVAQPDHAMRACRTALAMRAGLPEFNKEIQSRGIDPINFRVGIATGEVMVGNIGSIDHFNYTVLGDTVNLASRLEATGKEYGVHIIISEKTRTQIGDGWLLRELDTIAVKGKNEGVRIYELLGTTEGILDMTLYTEYEKALELYRAGSYLEAGKLWESQMTLDPPSEIMAHRCVDILSGRLVVENGIYRMLHK